MRTLIAIFLITIGYVLPVSAQVAKDSPTAPKTNFEKFLSKDGVVRITEFYEMPAIQPHDGIARATLINSKDVNTTLTAIALRFAFNTGKEYASDVSSILDADEIDSLASAIDYINRNRDAITTKATTYTEIIYVSRSQFRVGFYFEPKDKKIGYYIVVDRENVFLDDLSQLKSIASEAQKQIAEIRTQQK